MKQNYLCERRSVRQALLLFLHTLLYLSFLCSPLVSHAQSNQITLRGEELKLEKIIKEIRNQTNYEVVGNADVIARAKPISLNLKKASIETLLAKCSENQDFVCVLVENTIVIRTRMSTVAQEQSFKILKGKVVVDVSGVPVIGATVQDLVGNTAEKTVTNNDGIFTIKVPNNVTVLRVTHVEYNTLMYNIPRKESSFVIRLSTKENTLKEVVVSTGIYNRSQAQFTGSVRTITADELRKVSSSNLLSAISILDPAFRLPEDINAGSNPNKIPEIELRGQNSFTDQTNVNQLSSNATIRNVFADKPNTPLFVLDGFQVNLQRIFDLDMNRVERISVLKDASATSLYGSRGNNGVIVIETKQPKEGSLELSYRGGANFEVPDLSSYDLLNAAEKLSFERKVGYYTALFPSAQLAREQEYNNILKDVTRGVNTYWMAYPLNAVSVGQTHSLYVQGGSQSVRYGVNLFYKNGNGVMKGSGRSELNGGLTLSYRTSKLVFSNDLSINTSKSKESPYGTFGSYSKLNQYWTPYDENGKLKLYLVDKIDENFEIQREVNPLYDAALPFKNTTDQVGFTNNFRMEWNILDWLRATGGLSLTHSNYNADAFLSSNNSSFLNDSLPLRGRYDKTISNSDVIDGNFGFDIRKTFGKHLLNFITNANVIQDKSYNLGITTVGFPSDQITDVFFGRQFPVGFQRPQGLEATSRLVSGRVNGNYSYNNTYIVDLSGSIDASSQFGSKKRFAPFWSAGFAWNVQNEGFFKKYAEKGFVKFLKLRASLGTTGDQNSPPYSALSMYNYYQDNFYRGGLSAYSLGYGNTSLGWQKGFKRNIGVDVSVWDSRVNFTADYYYNTTNNLILDITTPPSLGFDSYKENGGSLLNTGWQASANVRVIQNSKKTIFWSLGLSAYANQNKIQSISNSLKKLNDIYDSMDNDPTNKNRSAPRVYYKEGESLTALYVVRSYGIDPANGKELYMDKNGKATYVWSSADKVAVGDTRPRLSGTLNTNFDYKGFSMGLYFTYQLGADNYNQTLLNRVENTNVKYNVDRRVAEQRWLKPGDHTFFKGIVNSENLKLGPISEVTLATSRFVQKEYMIQASNFSFSYQFPNTMKWIKSMKLSNFRIEAYVASPFRISTVKRERGLDYPFSQTCTINISANIF